MSLANWLIPGAGYLLAGDRARGIALFVAINGCFAIGLFLFGGYIQAPTTISPKSAEFNIVGLLTWIVQAFHGGGWLGLQALHRGAAENAEALFNMRRLGAGAYSDLGSLHLLVAGALNYFASVHLYELLTGQTEVAEQDGAGEAAA